MQISPETKTVAEIFPIQLEYRYKIPIYQRNYSWLNYQIDTFIEDINKESNGYYIGNILITKNEDKDFQEIVDGQQRLTTIALLLLAIYEISNNFSQSEAKQVGAMQSDIRRQLLIRGDILTPRYILLNSDNQIFNDILKTVLEEDKPYFGRKYKFSNRYQYIKDTLGEEFPTFSQLKNFYEKLNNVELLKITVTKLSDAFSIFSSLNSKGLPLTLVDLLKNEYLKQATKEKINTAVALSDWESLVNVFAESEEVNVRDVTQFLLNNYDALENMERRSITKGEALDKYINLISKGANYIHVLKQRSHWFDFIKDSDANVTVDKSIKELVYKLTFLDPSQSYPLLLLIFIKMNELELNNENMIDILTNIINFFVRRNITLKPKASNVRALFLNINRDIIENKMKSQAIVNYIKTALLKESVSDQILKQTLLEEGIYDKNSSTTRFILIDMERKMQEENKKSNKAVLFTKANPDTLDEYIASPHGKQSKLRWTIEHILPEGNKLPKHWEEMISPDNPGKAKTLQEEHVHKLGNLTLTPYNSELGQKSFIEKRDKMDGQNHVGLKLGLCINSSICNSDEGENIDTKTSWTIEDINRRTSIMADLIIKYYKLS